ncbi:DUF1501 domain-containing protein [Roseibacillus ishigakijimensis]|uniref:DUF1501 domain-containing protein n=1 Tax=Roseibacillus ishigakijimensis TaxID=454146 RepID=A0A934RPR8_9BACT|nr:DUF1501 domain-containing protein [Roseibacillus ishigakijimensis]MBK1834730.1 DUF1501 domain-containing protein [Roseibacillus ishigakijimensis]
MNRIDPVNEVSLARAQALTRRHFLQRCNAGLGAIALNQLLGQSAGAASAVPEAQPQIPMFAPKAKQVIYLHMAGSPPQHEMFDYKPELMKHHLQPCPEEFIEGKTFAFIKGRPKLLGSIYDFQQYGESGAWVGETMPHLAQHVDDLCFIKSMRTDQFNHAPAQLLLHTGNAQFGGASMGAWVTYGLGSMNNNLPGYMVMVSGGKNPSGGKSLWGSSFLPSVYQGVQCRAKGDPILYVSNPDGMSRDIRRRSLDTLNQLNRMELQQFQDPETLTRIEQYELAYRMQVAVPGVMDISKESPATLEKYGAKPGEASFANNCVLARRLIEQGVRFVQLFDWGWDLHGTAKVDDLETQFPKKCLETDRPIAALLSDLKERGLLEDTLVVWGGEFGRTPMNEARGGSKLLGRDHHPDCFTTWMAGGGVKPGLTYGATDELGYSVTENPVHVHDFQATIQHLLGLNPHQHSFPYQGLNQRLIGPTSAPKVVHDILA